MLLSALPAFQGRAALHLLAGTSAVLLQKRKPGELSAFSSCVTPWCGEGGLGNQCKAGMAHTRPGTWQALDAEL